MKQTKRMKKMLQNVEDLHGLELDKAISLCKSNATAKFDETVEISMNLGVDPRHADQVVRGVVSLPHGTGKTVKVLVFAKDDNVQKALDAGADYAGSDEYVKKIQDGWMDFDVVIATPDMMAKIGRLGRVLGPRGMMPNPKSGTVSPDVAKAVQEVKAGKIDFRTEKKGIVHAGIGKASFTEDKLKDNIVEFVKKVVALKPSSAKGSYIQKITISSTMGLGYEIDKSFVKNI